MGPCRSAGRAVAEVEHVPAPVASQKHDDIGEQDEQRREHDHDGRLAHASRPDQKIPEAAGEATRREFAGAEQQEGRSNTEHGQQREHEADQAGGSSDPGAPWAGGNGLRFRLPADRPWPMRGVKTVVDGCHGLTMRRALAARLRRMLRICGFSCSYRADAGAILPLPLAGGRDERSSLLGRRASARQVGAFYPLAPALAEAPPP